MSAKQKIFNPANGKLIAEVGIASDTDVEAAMKAVKSFLKAGDVVLLKASRASRLERIAETLKSEKS